MAASLTGTVSNSSNHAEPLQYELLDAPDSKRELLPLEWRVRVHRRARNLSLHVEPNGSVRVTVPPRTRPGDVTAFVQENVEWIAKAQDYYAKRVKNRDPLPANIALLATGLNVKVVYAECSGSARPRWEQSGAELRIQAPGARPETRWPLLRAWLKSIARAHLINEINALSTLINLYPKRVQIRLQKSRWGSCSSIGTVSLNAALMLRPPAQVRYLLVHELSHLKHMNHSRAYWAFVAQHETNYKRLDKALNEAWKQTPIWLLG
jgi:predicted metal-dependent hydrolase